MGRQSSHLYSFLVTQEWVENTFNLTVGKGSNLGSAFSVQQKQGHQLSL